jgi:hypothetical protein
VSTILSAEAILAAETRPTLEVEMPEWGGAVTIRAFSKAQYIAMQKSAGFNSSGEDGDLAAFQKQMFLHGVEDPKFTEEQIDALFESQGGTTVDRVLVAIAGLNKLSEEEAKVTKAKFRK